MLLCILKTMIPRMLVRMMGRMSVRSFHPRGSGLGIRAMISVFGRLDDGPERFEFGNLAIRIRVHAFLRATATAAQDRNNQLGLDSARSFFFTTSSVVQTTLRFGPSGLQT